MIALESGEFVRAMYIDPQMMFYAPPFFVKAEDLVPQAMAYYHGEVPL
ncbi:hypothetical protein [Variovorax sp. GT1P44]